MMPCLADHSLITLAIEQLGGRESCTSLDGMMPMNSKPRPNVHRPLPCSGASAPTTLETRDPHFINLQSPKPQTPKKSKNIP